MKGRHFLDKRNPDGIQKGYHFFQQAIDADPTYGLAYAGLAEAYEVMGGYQMLTPKEGYEKAEAAARKALTLDENLAQAHATLAFVKSGYYYDREGAEQAFRRAIQLSPNNSVVHLSYSLFLSHMARSDEAMAEINHALELDPLPLEN